MEQGGGTSITSPNSITENSAGKTKSPTVMMTPGSRLQSAKEKFKTSWVKKLFQEDCSAWDTLRIAFAEFMGTGMLVFLGCMGCVGSLGNEPPAMQAALTFGFTVMIVILTIGHISDAHINPAITVGAVVLGKKSLQAATVYFAAQCLGAVMGYGLLKVVTPQHLLYGNGGPESSMSFCVTEVHKDISLIQGFLIEAIATAILMLMTCGIWDIRNESNSDSVAIKFGFGIAAICMATAPYTGCSMNPARSLGPAIWNNNWANHWVYWFGPIAGSLVASVMYRLIFSPRISHCAESQGADQQRAEVLINMRTRPNPSFNRSSPRIYDGPRWDKYKYHCTLNNTT